MEFITGAFLPFVIILSIVVFFHELGHFVVARRNGVKIDAFSIGFGREIFGITDKHGTRWKFSLVPLGGYVKMYGDANVASQPGENDNLIDADPQHTLSGKTPWQRIKIAAAGPLANFILAIVLYGFVFLYKGVPHTQPMIGDVLENSLAAQSGLKSGDLVLEVNDERPSDFQHLANLIQKTSGTDAMFKVERGDEILDFPVKMYDDTPDKKPIKRLGVRPAQPIFKSVSIAKSFAQAMEHTYGLIVGSLQGIYKMITGQVSGGEIGGVLAIGDMASQSAKSGLATAILFMAFLSVQLGVLNLLPVPVLDGGHIFINAIEMIRGKPLTKKVEEGIYTVGFVMILSLMLFSTWNDLSRFKIFHKMGQLVGLS